MGHLLQTSEKQEIPKYKEAFLNMKAYTSLQGEYSRAQGKEPGWGFWKWLMISPISTMGQLKPGNETLAGNTQYFANPG